MGTADAEPGLVTFPLHERLGAWNFGKDLFQEDSKVPLDRTTSLKGLENSPRLTPRSASDRGAVARPAPGTRTGQGTPAARGDRTRQFNSPATCEISPANPLGCLFRKAFGSRASSPGAPLSEVVTESAISNARNGANSHHHGGLITMTRCALFSFAGASGSCLLEG